MRKNIKINFKLSALVFVLTALGVVAIGYVAFGPGLSGAGQGKVQVYVYVGVSLSILSAIMAGIFTNIVVRPLSSMIHTLSLVSKGQLPERSR
ncbi:MAG TPA: hypothetical protein PKW06_11790, partial [Cyclobacteriaceae bacterium]|nr:hypothetical protein [Cyclobacteriaceae bacterium]